MYSCSQICSWSFSRLQAVNASFPLLCCSSFVSSSAIVSLIVRKMAKKKIHMIVTKPRKTLQSRDFYQIAKAVIYLYTNTKSSDIAKWCNTTHIPGVIHRMFTDTHIPRIHKLLGICFGPIWASCKHCHIPTHNMWSSMRK